MTITTRRNMRQLAFLALALLIHVQQLPAQADKSLAWSLRWDTDWVTAVSFLDNKRIAAGNNLGQILVWSLPDKLGEPAPLPSLRLDGHSNTINRLLTTPDGLL